MIFNREKEQVIQAGVNFIRNSSKQVFQFSGPPGTGKTQCIHEIVRRSGKIGRAHV